MAKLSVPDGILGKVDGAFDFCAQADPQSASKYQEKKKEFSQGASDQELTEARASRDYKDGYQSSTDEMSKESQGEIKTTMLGSSVGEVENPSRGDGVSHVSDIDRASLDVAESVNADIFNPE